MRLTGTFDGSAEGALFKLDNAASRDVDAALRHEGAAAAGTSTRGVGRGLGARAEFPGVAAEVVAREGMAKPLRCEEMAAESRAVSARDALLVSDPADARVMSLRDAPAALSRCEASRCEASRAMSLRDAADELPGIDDADDVLVSCADGDPARTVARDVLSVLFPGEDDTGRVPSARDAAAELLRCDGAGPVRAGSPREFRAEDDRAGALDAAEATRAFTTSRNAGAPGRASAGNERFRVSSAAANAVSDFDFLAGERAIPQLRQPAP